MATEADFNEREINASLELDRLKARALEVQKNALSKLQSQSGQEEVLTPVSSLFQQAYSTTFYHSGNEEYKNSPFVYDGTYRPDNVDNVADEVESQVSDLSSPGDAVNGNEVEFNPSYYSDANSLVVEASMTKAVVLYDYMANETGDIDVLAGIGYMHTNKLQSICASQKTVDNKLIEHHSIFYFLLQIKIISRFLTFFLLF